jgi:hypothetical protein
MQQYKLREAANKDSPPHNKYMEPSSANLSFARFIMLSISNKLCLGSKFFFSHVSFIVVFCNGFGINHHYKAKKQVDEFNLPLTSFTCIAQAYFCLLLSQCGYKVSAVPICTRQLPFLILGFALAFPPPNCSGVPITLAPSK